MRMRCLAFLAAFLAVGAAASRATASSESISDMQANAPNNSSVTLAYSPNDSYQANTSDPIVNGVLSIVGTVAGHSYTNWSFFVYDGTGGTDIFGHMPSSGTPATSYTPSANDTVQPTGTWSPFDAIP